MRERGAAAVTVTFNLNPEVRVTIDANKRAK
jgi:hypothetical protein